MATVKLDETHSAEIADTVTNGVRRRAQVAYDQAEGFGSSREYAMFNVLLAGMITSWTLDRPLPAGDPAVLDELDLDQANRLYEALRPILPKLYPDFSPENKEGPTTPSSD